MKKAIIIWDKMARSFHNTSAHSSAHRSKYCIVAEEILKTNPESILDLGCGSGLLESELCRRGYCGQAHCYDASEKMLEIARNTVKASNIYFNKVNVDGCFNPELQFDAVVAINLFFYLDNKDLFLRAVAKCLKSKDAVFIMVNPKPCEDTSNKEFVKTHFGSNNGKGKVRTVLSELRNVPSYIELALRQSKLDKLEKSGEIVFDRPEAIKKWQKPQD